MFIATSHDTVGGAEEEQHRGRGGDVRGDRGEHDHHGRDERRHDDDRAARPAVRGPTDEGHRDERAEPDHEQREADGARVGLEPVARRRQPRDPRGDHAGVEPEDGSAGQGEGAQPARRHDVAGHHHPTMLADSSRLATTDPVARARHCHHGRSS